MAYQSRAPILASGLSRRKPSPGPICLLATYFKHPQSLRLEEGIRPVLSIPKDIGRTLDEKTKEAWEQPAVKKELFSRAEIEELVDSLGAEEHYEKWSYLDAASFSKLTMILIVTPRCLARLQGLFRLVEALESFKDHTRTQSLVLNTVQLPAFKATAGSLLIPMLLHRFLDLKDDPICRRWLGLILVELLELPKNRRRFLEFPRNTLRRIGGIIEESMERMLKIVAGKLIQVCIDGTNGEPKIELETFLPAIVSKGNDMEFPRGSNLQWEGDFAAYLVGLEEMRAQAGKRAPVGFNGLFLRLEGPQRPPIEYATGNVTCSVTEVFSIYVPPHGDQPCEWFDIDLSNIEEIHLDTKGVRSSAVTTLILRLRDYNEAGHIVLHSMARNSSYTVFHIQLHADEADMIVEDLLKHRDEYLKTLAQESSQIGQPCLPLHPKPLVAAPPEDILAVGHPMGVDEQHSDQDVGTVLKERRAEVKADVGSSITAQSSSPGKRTWRGAELASDPVELPTMQSETDLRHYQGSSRKASIRSFLENPEESVVQQQATPSGDDTAKADPPKPDSSDDSVNEVNETPDVEKPAHFGRDVEMENAPEVLETRTRSNTVKEVSFATRTSHRVSETPLPEESASKRVPNQPEDLDIDEIEYTPVEMQVRIAPKTITPTKHAKSETRLPYSNVTTQKSPTLPSPGLRSPLPARPVPADARIESHLAKLPSQPQNVTKGKIARRMVAGPSKTAAPPQPVNRGKAVDDVVAGPSKASAAKRKRPGPQKQRIQSVPANTSKKKLKLDKKGPTAASKQSKALDDASIFDMPTDDDEDSEPPKMPAVKETGKGKGKGKQVSKKKPAPSRKSNKQAVNVAKAGHDPFALPQSSADEMELPPMPLPKAKPTAASKKPIPKTSAVRTPAPVLNQPKMKKTVPTKTAKTVSAPKSAPPTAQPKKKASNPKTPALQGKVASETISKKAIPKSAPIKRSAEPSDSEFTASSPKRARKPLPKPATSTVRRSARIMESKKSVYVESPPKDKTPQQTSSYEPTQGDNQPVSGGNDQAGAALLAPDLASIVSSSSDSDELSDTDLATNKPAVPRRHSPRLTTLPPTKAPAIVISNGIRRSPRLEVKGNRSLVSKIQSKDSTPDDTLPLPQVQYNNSPDQPRKTLVGEDKLQSVQISPTKSSDIALFHLLEVKEASKATTKKAEPEVKARPVPAQVATSTVKAQQKMHSYSSISKSSSPTNQKHKELPRSEKIPIVEASTRKKPSALAPTTKKPTFPVDTPVKLRPALMSPLAGFVYPIDKDLVTSLKDQDRLSQDASSPIEHKGEGKLVYMEKPTDEDDSRGKEAAVLQVPHRTGTSDNESDEETGLSKVIIRSSAKGKAVDTAQAALRKHVQDKQMTNTKTATHGIPSNDGSDQSLPAVINIQATVRKGKDVAQARVFAPTPVTAFSAGGIQAERSTKVHHEAKLSPNEDTFPESGSTLAPKSADRIRVDISDTITAMPSTIEEENSSEESPATNPKFEVNRVVKDTYDSDDTPPKFEVNQVVKDTYDSDDTPPKFEVNQVVKDTYDSDDTPPKSEVNQVVKDIYDSDHVVSSGDEEHRFVNMALMSRDSGTLDTAYNQQRPGVPSLLIQASDDEDRVLRKPHNGLKGAVRFSQAIKSDQVVTSGSLRYAEQKSQMPPALSRRRIEQDSEDELGLVGKDLGMERMASSDEEIKSDKEKNIPINSRRKTFQSEKERNVLVGLNTSFEEDEHMEDYKLPLAELSGEDDISESVISSPAQSISSNKDLPTAPIDQIYISSDTYESTESEEADLASHPAGVSHSEQPGAPTAMNPQKRSKILSRNFSAQQNPFDSTVPEGSQKTRLYESFLAVQAESQNNSRTNSINKNILSLPKPKSALKPARVQNTVPAVGSETKQVSFSSQEEGPASSTGAAEGQNLPRGQNLQHQAQSSRFLKSLETAGFLNDKGAAASSPSDRRAGSTRGPPDEDPDKTLIGREDSEDSDSDSSYTTEDSEEDAAEEESDAEDDEASHLVWRTTVPEYHRETLAVLDKISQCLLRYLMTGEELATEVITDFEKQGNEIIARLGEAHKGEYDAFRDAVDAAKAKLHTVSTAYKARNDGLIADYKKVPHLNDVMKQWEDDHEALMGSVSKVIEGLKQHEI